MWETIISGTVAGLIAGLIVAATTAAVARFSHRRFELRKVGEEDFAILINRGWRPVLLGNSQFLNGMDELKLGDEPDSPISLAYLRPNDDLVVRLGGRHPGSTVFFTYRPMLWRPRRKRELQLRDEARNIGPFIFKLNPFPRWKEFSVTVTL